MDQVRDTATKLNLLPMKKLRFQKLIDEADVVAEEGTVIVLRDLQMQLESDATVQHWLEEVSDVLDVLRFDSCVPADPLACWQPFS